MSRSGKIRRFFGDADYDLKIGIGEAEELDELFQLGLLELIDRAGAVHVRIIRETIRVALVGGGMDKERAATLAARHVADGYFAEAAQLAADVLDAAIRGAPEDPPGEDQGEVTTPIPSPTAE